MGFRTVIVNSRCKLECRLNYLIVRGEREKRIFIHEINTLIVQSTAVSLTAALLCELEKYNVKVIFCDEKCNPQTELLPYYGAQNTSKRYKMQFRWKEETKREVRKQIIKQKICNQAAVLLENGFSFDFADKKIISLLYKKLQSNYQDGSFILQLNEINTYVGIFLQDLCRTIDFALDYHELILEDLLKSCSVKPAKIYDSILEKIVCYINLFVSLKNIRFFVFVGLKDILSDDDLERLYRHCLLQKVSLLLLESSKKRPLLPQERAIIITDDLCEIVENFSQNT